MDSETLEMLLGMVGPEIQRRDTIMRESVPAKERLLVTLRYLATGESYPELMVSYAVSPQLMSKIIPETCLAIYKALKDEYLKIQDDTADLHGVSQPFISKICKNIAETIARKSHSFIKMPATLREQEEAMQKFRRIANFPTVIGAINCTHIKIKKPSENGGQLYINRKGFASINVQVVCDADLKIMDIVTRWRGSVHDSRIFRESRLKQRFEAGAFSGILLGDSGYACTPYLFTPLLRTTTPQEERYNNAHISTRNTVERCFGLWKQRFRCLLRGLYCNIELQLLKQQL
ncbi:unnamed protein product, partial [Brenthis ino]